MSEFQKLNSEYFEGITQQIKAGINAIADLTKEKNQLDKMIKSGNYAGEKLHELNEEFTKVKMDINREKEERERTVTQMCAEFAEALRSEDDLHPSDIVSSDLELLKHMNLLTDRDLKAMIDRNKNNRTMTQLIIRKCRQHDNRDLQLGIEYVGNNNKIRNVNMIPGLCKTVLKYDDGLQGSAGYVFNEILGAGTTLAEMFSPEND